MTVGEHTTHRETTLDVLRGLAVLGMVAAHVIFFTHNGTNPLLNNIQRLANTIVLTIFVFVSGAVTSKILDKYGHIGLYHRIVRFFRVAGVIYFAYIVTATVALLTANPAIEQRLLLSKLIGAAILVHPPNFTEYMPLFILFPLVGIGLNRFYRLIRGRTLIMMMSAVGFYAIGLFLYPLTLPSPWNEIKILLAGGTGLLRFPLLFYFPVYLVGLWWEFRMETGSERAIQRSHIVVLSLAALAAIIGTVITWQYDIPVLSPGVRWPPSIGYLATGVAVSSLLAFLLHALPIESWIRRVYRFVAYLGRDAFDLWMTHLVLLFSFRKFVAMQFGDIPTVLFLYCIVLLVSTFLSSIALTSGVSLSRIGPVAIAPARSRRLRKRYGVLAVGLTGIIMWSVTSQPATTLYGNLMPVESFAVYDQLPSAFSVTLSSEAFWHIRTGPQTRPIRLHLSAIDTATKKPLALNPTTVTITAGNTHISTNAVSVEKDVLYYEIPADTFAAGRYEVKATVATNGPAVTSNSVDIIVSEPLLVAWTFDWEGWDVPDSTLKNIEDFGHNKTTIPFTHFVNPRMFLEGVIEKSRRDYLREYLINRSRLGDEIALHLHMQYDFVKAAGITPRTSPHWGLQSSEGYDVPTTAYTTDEFRRIVSYALDFMNAQGFTKPKGYRAGGWSISSHQLAVLNDLGLAYDSSGRDRPARGAFSTISWDLPINVTPYYPDFDDQNTAKTTTGGLLEIPNNGVTTYESSAEELLTRATAVYQSGILDKPKMLVITSHPQFAANEFSKIPVVLGRFMDNALARDQGPVIFTTVYDIYTLWISLL